MAKHQYEAHRGGQQPRDPNHVTSNVTVRFTVLELEKLERLVSRKHTTRSHIIREALVQCGLI